MATLTKQAFIDALAAEVARREGTAAEIAAALNAPEVTGYETGTIDTGAAYETISPATLLALDTAAGSDGAQAGNAIWWLSALADVEPISLAAGTTARAALDALTGARLIPQEECDALLAAARVEVLGPSWGQAQGIGHIETAWVQEVRE